jgi:uncharacterized protein (TIGR00251 family)
MPEAAKPWTLAADGLVVTVRLTPKGGRDAIDGIARLADGRAVVKARVRSAPSEGAANAALIRLMADALAVAPRGVSLAAGATARIKRLKIAGDGAALAAALGKIVG